MVLLIQYTITVNTTTNTITAFPATSGIATVFAVAVCIIKTTTSTRQHSFAFCLYWL